HTAAQQAAVDLAQAEQKLTDFSAESAEVEKERTDAAAARATAGEALARVAQRREEAQKLIVDARGESESVSARIAAMSDLIRTVRAYADARDECTRRAAALTDAQAAQAEALAGSEFDDATGVRAALRSASEQQT